MFAAANGLVIELANGLFANGLLANGLAIGHAVLRFANGL